VIYFVEDDKSIRELVIYTLDSTGFKAKGCADGAELYEALSSEPAELILLDIMLPKEDGISILKRLRANPATSKIPVIMVTAKSSEYDKVIGLDSGADDYITKPFGMMELLARVRAMLRRASPGVPDECIKAGGVEVCPEQRQVTVCGREIALTFKEFELLLYLLKNRGIVVSRDKILEVVWGYACDIETRTVDVHIRTLRHKLGAGGDIIETVRGVGYRIAGE
jgi:two-component system alkaline phosphatase synthesis response regulator PhoP